MSRHSISLLTLLLQHLLSFLIHLFSTPFFIIWTLFYGSSIPVATSTLVEVDLSLYAFLSRVVTVTVMLKRQRHSMSGYNHFFPFLALIAWVITSDIYFHDITWLQYAILIWQHLYCWSRPITFSDILVAMGILSDWWDMIRFDVFHIHQSFWLMVALMAWWLLYWSDGYHDTLMVAMTDW